jgi:hypothetical protein
VIAHRAAHAALGLDLEQVTRPPSSAASRSPRIPQIDGVAVPTGVARLGQHMRARVLPRIGLAKLQKLAAAHLKGELKAYARQTPTSLSQCALTRASVSVGGGIGRLRDGDAPRPEVERALDLVAILRHVRRQVEVGVELHLVSSGTPTNTSPGARRSQGLPGSTSRSRGRDRYNPVGRLVAHPPIECLTPPRRLGGDVTAFDDDGVPAEGHPRSRHGGMAATRLAIARKFVPGHRARPKLRPPVQHASLDAAAGRIMRRSIDQPIPDGVARDLLRRRSAARSSAVRLRLELITQ